MEELDEFGIPIKATSSQQEVDEFGIPIKKKEATTQEQELPVQQPTKPSAPSFGQKVVGEALTQEVQVPLRGQQKAPVQKKPYQDITYKREELPSETTQMPETPVVKAAKKDFKESQIKPQVQLKSTPEELEAIEKKTEKADTKGLVLNEYQSSADIFNELNLLKKEDANDFYRNLKDARPDLYEKYSGRTIEEGRNLEGDMRQSQEDRDLVYKNYLSDLQRANETHQYSINKVTPIIDSIVDEKVTPESYGKFTTGHSMELGGDVVDMSKVDDEASAIAEKYNLPTDGDSWRLLKNKIKSSTDFQIIKPQAEQIFKSKYPELQAKRQKMFEDGFKYDDEIYPRVEAELVSLQNQYAADAKNEFNAIDADYKSKSELLNQQYKEFTDQATQVESNLNDLYKTGQIDQLTYETRWSDLQKEKKDYFEAYKKDFPSLDEYVKKSNEINSKYNRKFELQKKALTDKAQAQIKAEFDKYASTYKEDPAVLDELNKAYRESFELASDIRTKKMGLGAELSNVPMMTSYQSTLASLGGVFKGWAGSLDSKTLELLGESMEQNFMMPAARTEEFKDWLDPQNLQLLTGQLLGSMAPSMAITAAVATATGGSGVPAIVPMVTGGLAGWSAETVDIVGRSYLDMFEKSGGNVAEANKAAERSLKSQYDLMWTYSFDALPFVGKVLGGIPTKVGRVAAGAGIEMGTEFLQEYPQNIAEENIQKGLDPWTNLGEALQDTKKMKQTLISIGPVAILGGAGQLGSKSARQEAVDTYVAMQQKAALSAALPDQKRQYIQDMVFSRKHTFARGVVGALYADGTIDEETANELYTEIGRAIEIREAGKEAGLKGSKLNIYGFYSARAQEAERNAAKFGNDPILFESYKQQAKQYRDAGLDFMKGNNPDLLTVTYADGSQAMMTPEDVNGLFSNPIALTLLNNKKISVESYREKGEGAKALQELSERAEAYKQTKRYTAPAKRGTSLEYWQGLANRRIEQLKTQQPELSEEERLAAIKKIEDEANASFQAQIDQEKQRKLMELEQKELTEKQRQEEIKRIEEEETTAFKIKVQEFEQKKRDQRDIDIEQMQQQRESLGVNEVNAFFSDMKPLVGTAVERMEAGKSVSPSVVKTASDYLYTKYKELTAMKADPNRMMTVAQIESVQAQIEQDLETLAGNPPSQKTEARDQENIQGVPGEVGVGQEPVQAEPVEAPSTETPEAGGVLQAPEEEVTPITEVAPEVAPKPKKPSLGQRLRTAAEAAETTVTVQEPAPVKEEKEEGAAPAPKKEKKPTKAKAKAPEIAPAPRRADAVEASEGSNENAGVESALDGVEMDETSLNEWKKANKAPSKKGRIEELTQLVRDLMSGKIKFKDYYEKAKQLMPSKLMDKVPALTSFKEIVGSIDKNKLGIGIINLNKFVKKGMKVGLRIDIPAFNNFGKNVVTVHDRTGSGQPVIGYGSTGSIQNVNFRTSVSTAAKIGAGEDKSAFAMAIGEWMDESPESIQARAEEALNSPEWIQVSMNPTRSSFFFDKADGNPVIAADEVLQVGNLVLAKNAQKIDLNAKEGMTQFEKMFSAKTKEGVTFQYRRGTSLGQRLRATFDTAGERAAEDIARFLEESGIDVQIIDSVEAERIGQERNIEGSIDGIFFADKDSGVIYLNRDALKGQEGATIAYHEGIHPVINIIRNTNPELYGAIVAGIRDEAKRNPAIARVIRQIESVKEYQKRGPEAIEDEIVVEVLAQIASGGIKLNELDKTLKQKMIEFFNKLVERMPRLAAAFNLKPVKVDATSQELLDFSKKLSAALTEGGRISDVVGAENVMEFAPPVSLSITDDAAQELIVPGSQITGTPSIGQPSIANSRIEGFVTTPPKVGGVKMKYPKPRTMEDVLSDSGGAAVFVNSDGTKVGVVNINGKKYEVQGGLDYTFIEKNVKDNVGFAASENQKISTLNSIAKGIAELRDQKDPKHKGKPIAVFVVSQNGEAMLGEWYAGEYIMEGIDKALTEGTYEGGINAAREQFSNAIKDVVITTKTEDGKKDNKARNTLIEMIESNLFDTHKGRMKIADFLSSKEVSFGLRSKINGEILAANPKLSGRGKNQQLKKALADAGHHMEDFWKLFADERFLPAIEKERLVPEKGKVFANKTFSGFYYDPFIPMEKQIEHTKKGVKHRQFNSKFKSVGNHFLLTEAHDVNKLFPDMGYADNAGYEIYNKANNTDVGKKSSIGDRIKVSEWLNKNGYNKNVINPYSSISLSIYTGYVTDEYKAPGAKIPSSKIKGQASLIDRSKTEEAPKKKQKLFSIEKARELLSKAEYTSLPSALELLAEYPKYLDNVAKVILTQRQKLLDGKMPVRDVAKAYILTQGSIGSDFRYKDVLEKDLKAVGLTWKSGKDDISLFEENGKIRPEELTAWWLGTPNGKLALDDLEKGIVNESAFNELEAIRRSYGKNNFRLNSVFGNRKADRFIYGQKPEKKNEFNLANVIDLTNAINETKGDNAKIQELLTRVKGISEGKKGFIGHMLGIGNMPTVDAVELNFWFTGKGEAKVKDLDEIKAQTITAIRENISALNEDVYKEISGRIKQLSEQIAAKYPGVKIPEEAMQHVLHHWIWDKARQSATTHQGMYRALGQYSLLDRSGNDIGPLIEEAADAVEQAIASGTAPQQALDEFIGGQEWYSDLTPGQRKQIDNILQEEFGTTPKVSVKKPTGIKATIANIIENYYKGDRQSKQDNKQILESDPKLKYIYDNISKINEQLQDAGIITEKTDGCP